MRQRPEHVEASGRRRRVSSCSHPAKMDGRAAINAPRKVGDCRSISPTTQSHHGSTPIAAKAVALRTRVASSALSTVNLAASAKAATAAAPKQTRDRGSNQVLFLPSLRPTQPRTNPGATNFDVAFLQTASVEAGEGAYSRGAGRRPRRHEWPEAAPAILNGTAILLIITRRREDNEGRA